ncbi:MAG: hypothetical protein M0R17_03470 [Candidatus Omnitrophica bacterium]|jgi:hypothetical protein|nr:hypothetical protein [Candidatus Omnitrophota bacterium]
MRLINFLEFIATEFKKVLIGLSTISCGLFILIFYHYASSNNLVSLLIAVGILLGIIIYVLLLIAFSVLDEAYHITESLQLIKSFNEMIKGTKHD